MLRWFSTAGGTVETRPSRLRSRPTERGTKTSTIFPAVLSNGCAVDMAQPDELVMSGESAFTLDNGAVVHAGGASFQYNSVEVLTAISFQLARGDYLGLVGPNGSGKTTLIRLLLGFMRPTRGTILLFGQPTEVFDQWQRIGYLPQKPNTFNPHFPATVKEVVGLGLLSRKGFPRRIGKGDAKAVDRALELMDIRNIKQALIGELSGGQQQRVLIARALVNKPELLVLDEPTTALDPESREKFFGTLSMLNREQGVTIIIVTHDIGTIGKYASKLLYVDKRVIFCGSFEDFCISPDMGSYFGEHSQHLICHRHDEEHG
jgi:zinc transport system ATP-binding protein